MTVEQQERTHPPVADKVACVDFDGTIAPWGAMFAFPEPLPGVVEAIKRLKEAGFQVVIFTSRLSPTWHAAEGWDTNVATKEQVEYLREYCERYGIDADAATAEKIPAEVYLDDKALQVDKSHTILGQVETFLSSGLFWLKPSNSRVPARWHRVAGELKQVVTTNGVGTFYEWEGKAVCGQEIYGLNREKYEDLFEERKYGARIAHTRDVEKGYCQHCKKRDEKEAK